jgi:hypothetical protein
MKLITSILIALFLLLATISIGFSEAGAVMANTPSQSPSRTSKSTSTASPSNTRSATPKSSHIAQDCRKIGICLAIVIVLGLVLVTVGYGVYFYCWAKKATLPFTAAKAVWGMRKG